MPGLQMNEVEADDEGYTAGLRPLAEVCVDKDCYIKSIVRGDGNWTVLDKNGRLHHVTLPSTSAFDSSGYEVGTAGCDSSERHCGSCLLQGFDSRSLSSQATFHCYAKP